MHRWLNLKSCRLKISVDVMTKMTVTSKSQQNKPLYGVDPAGKASRVHSGEKSDNDEATSAREPCVVASQQHKALYGVDPTGKASQVHSGEKSGNDGAASAREPSCVVAMTSKQAYTKSKLGNDSVVEKSGNDVGWRCHAGSREFAVKPCGTQERNLSWTRLD